MKLTLGQTNLILDKLKDYNFGVVEFCKNCDGNSGVISEDYFFEKVNEALEVEK